MHGRHLLQGGSRNCSQEPIALNSTLAVANGYLSALAEALSSEDPEPAATVRCLFIGRTACMLAKSSAVLSCPA
jgi:hypothetical protein